MSRKPILYLLYTEEKDPAVVFQLLYQINKHTFSWAMGVNNIVYACYLRPVCCTEIAMQVCKESGDAVHEWPADKNNIDTACGIIWCLTDNGRHTIKVTSNLKEKINRSSHQFEFVDVV